jgi:hypothetical protein
MKAASGRVLAIVVHFDKLMGRRIPNQEHGASPFPSQESGYENTFGLFGKFPGVQHTILDGMQRWRRRSKPCGSA